MARGLTYKHLRKAGVFVGGDLAAGQIGVDTTNGAVYFSTNGVDINLVDEITPGERLAITNAIPTSQKGVANGVATLDGSGKIPTAQMPPIALSSVRVAANQAAMLALTAEEGDVVKLTDTSKVYMRLGTGATNTLAGWVEVTDGSGAITTVFGRTGAVVASNGDYNGTQITNSSSVAGATVHAALNTLFTDKANTAHTHDADAITGGALAWQRYVTTIPFALDNCDGTVDNPNLIFDGGTL